MKILYLHQYFNSLEAAGSTRSYEMARRLVARGHQVELITSDRSPPGGRGRFYSRITMKGGIRVHWIPVPYSNHMGFARRLISFFEFVLRTALKAISLEYDLVFASSTPLTIAIPAVYASRHRRVPMVLEIRDLWPDLPIAIGALKSKGSILAARRLELFSYKNATRVVALSPGMKEGIEKTGYPGDRIHVIPNSADMDLFTVPREEGKAFRRRYDWLGDRPLIVYTGAIGLMNGVQYLVRLAAIAKQLSPDVRFLVVGDGREKLSVLQEARDAGILGRNFFLMAPLSKNKMPPILSAADICTSLFIDLPAMQANSANKFFDALASGTPVAINYRGWQADLLEQSGAGLVLTSKGIEDDALKLLRALHDSSWLSEAGRRAKSLARTLFSRDMLAGELERVLISAMSG